jgi:hypothetical protein
MIFFLLLSLFIVPHCYGAASSFTKKGASSLIKNDANSLDQKERCFFLTSDKEYKSLINNFKNVLYMPTDYVENFFYNFENLASEDLKIVALKNDYNTRLRTLIQDMSKLKTVIQKIDEFKDGKFVCIKVKPFGVLKAPKFPSTTYAYSNFLANLIEVIPVDTYSEIIEQPESKLDFVKNYCAQKNMINFLSEQLKRHEEEKNTLAQSVNDLTQEKIFLVQEKTTFEEKLKTVNEQKQSLEKQLAQEKNNAKAQADALQKQVREHRKQKDALSQDKQRLEEQLAEQTSNAEQKADKLQAQLKAANEEKQRLERELIEQKKNLEKQAADLTKVFLGETKLKNEEEKLKNEALKSINTLKEEIARLKKESGDEIARLQIQLNESGIMPKLNKISKWKALGVTVFGLLIAILAYNWQALKNIDVQSCLK